VTRRRALALALLPLLGGCASIGPARLNHDQLEYTLAMSEASKRQTLFNIVRLRYADAPAFVSVNQLVSTYSLQRSGGASMEVFPRASGSTFFGLTGGLQLTDTPTFTMQPVSGEQFVNAYVAPLAPHEVVPLIQGGVPVELLLGLVAQSIGGLQNTHPLAQRGREGSPQFYALLGLLKRLQEGGVLGTQVRRVKDGTQAFLTFNTSNTPDLVPVVREVFALVDLDPKTQEAAVVYGNLRTKGAKREIPLVTRSLLGVMAAVAMEIEVAPADIASGRTIPTLREHRSAGPLLRVHTGPDQPTEAYAAVKVRNAWHWISDDDFHTKLVFGLLELLKSIAESNQNQTAPVLTIPAR
jgi:hypothetical protein